LAQAAHVRGALASIDKNEIADTTGTERGTVKTRMFYARKRLAELLGKQGIAVA
jgi:DNA-directed RNA polymerase specialized sigma24 family protein